MIQEKLQVTHRNVHLLQKVIFDNRFDLTGHGGRHEHPVVLGGLVEEKELNYEVCA